MNGDEDFGKFINHLARARAKADENLQYFHQITEIFDDSYTDTNNKISNQSPYNLAKQVIQKFGKILEHFNAEIELIFNEFDKLIPSNDVVDGVLPDISTSIHQNALKPLVLDVSMYRTDMVSDCQITNIIDPIECICYLVDNQREYPSELIELWKQPLSKSVHLMYGLPNFGEIFGIEINSRIYRATRKMNICAKRVLLIDTGEMVSLDFIQNCNHFVLSPRIKSVPPFAVLCKVLKIGSNSAITLNESHKQGGFNFKVKMVCNIKQMLYVELFSKNPFLDDYDEYSPNENISATGASAKNEEILNFPSIGNYTEINECVQTPAFSQCSETRTLCKSNEDKRLSSPSSYSLINSSLEAKLNAIHNESMKMFFRNYIHNNLTNSNCSINSEPNTFAKKNSKHTQSNLHDTKISLQVHGGTVSMKNDVLSRAKLSNFLNFQIIENEFTERDFDTHNANGLERISNQNGIIKPSKSQYIQNFDVALNVPKTGETITIIPLHIISVNEFYARLSKNHTIFKNFHMKLNSDVLAGEHRRCTVIPDKLKLVLVRLLDGALYRAKILNNSAVDCIEVFCLDSGYTKIVPLENIFQWLPVCSMTPFQAILCTIVNIEPCHLNDTDAVNHLENMILNTLVLAEVKKINPSGIFLRILDDIGFDIGDEIRARRLAMTQHKR